MALYNVVTGYGAKGDGSTDDATAINAAVSAASAAGGGIVYFPEATYIVGAPIVLQSNVILLGDGYGSCIKLKNSTISDVVTSAATSIATMITNAGVENLHIDGNKANQTTGNDNQNYGISLLGANRCWVDNCFIHDVKRSAIYFAGSRNRASFNVINDIGTVGSAGSTVIGRSGIVFDQYINAGTVNPFRSRAIGNEIDTTLEHGIKVYPNGDGSVLEGNTITGWGYVGIWMEDASECAVNSNTIRDGKSYGILFGNTSVGRNNSCTGNNVARVLTSAAGINVGIGVGISFETQTGGSIVGGAIVACDAAGVYVSNSNGVGVSSVTVDACGASGSTGGITLYQSVNCNIRGNTSRNNGTTGSRGAGLQMWDSGTANTGHIIDGNNFYDTAAGASKKQNYGIQGQNGTDSCFIGDNNLVGNFTAEMTMTGTSHKLSPVTKVLAADQSNSTTTPTKVTGLDTPTQLGTYQFKYMIRYQAAATTTGVKFDVNHSGTVTAFVWNQHFADVVGTASSATPDQDSVLAAATVYGVFASRAKGTAGRGVTLSVDTANADMLMIIEGMFTASVAGDLQLYHGSEVAFASTVGSGSSLVLTKVF
jgi:parallel beta-helix repeat protein